MEHSSQASAIETRRRKIALLRLGGMESRRQIARELGVSPQTIGRDFDAIEEQWRAQANPADWDAVKGRELARTEALIEAIWADATDKTNEKRTWFIDRMIALLERRAKYLGLDAPQRVDVTARLLERASALGLDPQEAITAAERLLKSGLT